MADPLNVTQAKALLAEVARGQARSRDARRPTTRQAKERLRRVAGVPTLLRLARIQPLLAVAAALGYGFLVGSGRIDERKLSGHLYRILMTSLFGAHRTGS